mmetsp:Transcript_7077/g.43618  ORF Transcript_7077/g.43618 Transcript_7077/m.43618 type:complete len:115 (+) Transcript_7077:93-437(+)
MGGPHLRFCPTSNDLLYPKEDRTRKRLVYTCKTCGYQEDAESGCVYRNEFSHTEAEKTVVLLDDRADPTRPRTTNVQCSKCESREAVYVTESTTEGMTLYFQCTRCGNKWRDYV